MPESRSAGPSPDGSAISRRQALVGALGAVAAGGAIAVAAAGPASAAPPTRPAHACAWRGSATSRTGAAASPRGTSTPSACASGR